MKNKCMIFSILFLLSIASISLTSITISMIGTNTNTEFKATSSSPIVFIYDTTTYAANDYKSFLDANGFPTTIINVTDVNSSSQLTQYGLIMVGHDFVHFTVDTVNAINDSLRPILAFSDKGSKLFQNLSLDMVSSLAMAVGPAIINATNSSHPIFKIPQIIPTTGPITLYIPSMIAGFPANISSPSPDILLIGRDSFNPTYYDIVAQHNRYIYWSYSYPPMNMTTEGKNLFLNIVNYFIADTDGKRVPGFEALVLLVTLPAMIILFRKTGKR